MPSTVKVRAALIYTYEFDDSDFNYMKTRNFFHIVEGDIGACPWSASISGWFSPKHIRKRFPRQRGNAIYLGQKALIKLDSIACNSWEKQRADDMIEEKI